MDRDEAGVQWGVQHSQGIRWESTEAAARNAMEWLLKSDARSQFSARGKVRLVKREIGPLIEVLNPYLEASMHLGSDDE